MRDKRDEFHGIAKARISVRGAKKHEYLIKMLLLAVLVADLVFRQAHHERTDLPKKTREKKKIFGKNREKSI